ncbi:MAG: transcription elongation factor NusA, partial [Candidatus Limnocylindrales bacterium]
TVGQRGARVQAVVAELGGEKIDVIPWSDDAGIFVANALSPAQVISVDIDEEHRIASVTVPERMLSLAIGREGQNARLAARLTGWRIDIRSDVSVAEAKALADADPIATQATAEVQSDATAEAPTDAPAKPKRVTKKAAAEAAATTPVADEAGEEPPVKPKRVTKKAAAEAAATTPDADEAAAQAPAKPKRVTKKVSAKAADPITDEVAS